MNAISNKAKCCFCEKPGATEPGFCKKLKPRFAHTECVERVRWLAQGLDGRIINERGQATRTVAHNYGNLSRDGRNKLKVNLSFCACGHKADKHSEDNDGNLLKCSKCDCARFWYAVPQHRPVTALVVLREASVSVEPSVIDKLAAMANDPRTNANERIAASRRISALLQKEAA